MLSISNLITKGKKNIGLLFIIYTAINYDSLIAATIDYYNQLAYILFQIWFVLMLCHLFSKYLSLYSCLTRTHLPTQFSFDWKFHSSHYYGLNQNNNNNNNNNNKIGINLSHACKFKIL